MKSEEIREGHKGSQRRSRGENSGDRRSGIRGDQRRSREIKEETGINKR